VCVCVCVCVVCLWWLVLGDDGVGVRGGGGFMHHSVMRDTVFEPCGTLLADFPCSHAHWQRE
jgi:hypothetical protein